MNFNVKATAEELRNYLGLEQKAFADLLGISQPTVARWESGESKTPRWVWLAVKGATFSHDGRAGCYCPVCKKARAARGEGDPT